MVIHTVWLHVQALCPLSRVSILVIHPTGIHRVWLHAGRKRKEKKKEKTTEKPRLLMEPSFSVGGHAGSWQRLSGNVSVLAGECAETSFGILQAFTLHSTSKSNAVA